MGITPGKFQLTENGDTWEEDVFIEDFKPITFKKKSLNEFYTFLDEMRLNPWNMDKRQAGLLLLEPKNPTNFWHTIDLYSYQQQNDKRIDLIADPQPKLIFPVAELGQYLEDHDFLPTPYVWIDAPGFQPLGNQPPFKQENPEMEVIASKKVLSLKSGPLTEDEKLQITILANEGHSQRSIGERIYRNHKIVGRYLEKIGFNKKCDIYLTENEKIRIEIFAKQGLSQREIATKIDRDHKTVGRHLKSLELKENNKITAREDQRHQIGERVQNKERADISKEARPRAKVTRKNLKKAGAFNPSKGKPLTREKKAKIIELTKNGKSTQGVAEEVGCADSTVLNHLKKAGVSKNSSPKGKRLTPEDKSKIIELANEGHTRESIAKTVDCNKGTVTKTLKKAGVTNWRLLTDLQKKQIVELKEKQWSTPDIAEEVGCSQRTVRTHLKKAGYMDHKSVPRLTKERKDKF